MSISITLLWQKLNFLWCIFVYPKCYCVLTGSIPFPTWRRHENTAAWSPKRAGNGFGFLMRVLPLSLPTGIRACVILVKGFFATKVVQYRGMKRKKAWLRSVILFFYFVLYFCLRGFFSFFSENHIYSEMLLLHEHLTANVDIYHMLVKMPCVPQGMSTGTSALPTSVKVLASRTRRKVLFSCTRDQIQVTLRCFLTMFVCGVTQLWLNVQGCTCFSGRDDDWQDHSVIFLGSTGRCNKDGLGRVQAGVTPHLSRKESGYASGRPAN